MIFVRQNKIIENHSNSFWKWCKLLHLSILTTETPNVLSCFHFFSCWTYYNPSVSNNKTYNSQLSQQNKNEFTAFFPRRSGKRFLDILDTNYVFNFRTVLNRAIFLEQHGNLTWHYIAQLSGHSSNCSTFAFEFNLFLAAE